MAVPAAEGPEPQSPRRKRGRPPGSKPKPPPPATVPADSGAGGEPLPPAPPAPVAPEPEQQPQQQPRHPVRMTPSQERRMRQNRLEQLAVAASRLQPLLYKRYNELEAAAAMSGWRTEGEEYTDAVGRLTDTVNRRLPQLRYASAERAGVRCAARDVAAGRNTQELGVVGGIM